MLPVLDEEVIRHRIAKRIALDFEDGAVVNLGIGIPTPGIRLPSLRTHVLLQTENGVVGAGPKLRKRGPGSSAPEDGVSLLPDQAWWRAT